MHSRLAAVAHGLVERLETFESVGPLFGGGREVFVEPTVGSTPGVRVLRAELLGKIFADEWMGVDGGLRVTRTLARASPARGRGKRDEAAVGEAG